ARRRCPETAPDTAVRNPWRPSRFLDRAVPDVAAILHAVKAYAIQQLVGTLLRLPGRAAERRDAQHASARGHELSVLERGTGMEDHAFFRFFGQTGNDVTLARVQRI